MKKPPIASTSTLVKKAPLSSAVPSSKAPPAKAAEPLRYKFSQEDAEFQSETIFPIEISTGLADSNWKARLETMEALEAWLRGGELVNVESEMIVRYLAKKPAWKESNFQVRLLGLYSRLIH